ncbi:hypothetical protein TELCIR_06243 [Teladorsagia circumcincta]|uniref:Uncharacterized protein n=1 Tax=Teladorsagia circumcincta TaxID=45464 RepID=A0A2G9UNJ1_TELCI|nr:hypothetical protein TELCIR_06243 [Teladorsagia circumcincta]
MTPNLENSPKSVQSKRCVKDTIILADETPRMNMFLLFRSLLTLPHPSFIYLYFHHWTFFNTKRSRLVLDYQPTIGFEVNSSFRWKVVAVISIMSSWVSI